jgi:hypothetical protein
MTIENNAKFVDFQAEYDGSIPFIRSNFLTSAVRRTFWPLGDTML